MLHYNTKIEVRKSDVHGYGVFAKESIIAGEILEECHYIKVKLSTDVYRYVYNWPKRRPTKYYAIALGNACIYNSSLKGEEPNADWETNIERDIFIFRSIKDIKQGEEIIIYYGDSYWNY